jgi:hypothetical protein
MGIKFYSEHSITPITIGIKVSAGERELFQNVLDQLQNQIISNILKTTNHLIREPQPTH